MSSIVSQSGQDEVSSHHVHVLPQVQALHGQEAPGEVHWQGPEEPSGSLQLVRQDEGQGDDGQAHEDRSRPEGLEGFRPSRRYVGGD